MKKRRNKTTIINDILNATKQQNGIARTTYLIHKANLSTHTLNNHLIFLKKKQLITISYINKIKHYTITEKGLRWIQKT